MRVSQLALIGAFALGAAGGAASPAAADVLGVDLAATPTSGTLFSPDTFNLGYQFTANGSNVMVTGLGVFDNGSLSNFTIGANGPIPELVGLWDVSNSNLLVASATVDGSSTQNGFWAFTALSSAVTLNAGDTYVVGAQGGEFYYAALIPITVDPAITYVADAFVTPTDLSTLQEPTLTEGLTSTGDAGLFGGNIETAAVPEPMSLSLFGMALTGFGLLRRRRRA